MDENKDKLISTTCAVCGLLRGGLNNYKCHCNVTLLDDLRWPGARGNFARFREFLNLILDGSNGAPDPTAVPVSASSDLVLDAERRAVTSRGAAGCSMGPSLDDGSSRRSSSMESSLDDGSSMGSASDDADLDFEIKMMECEGVMTPRWQRGLTWLRELQRRRTVQRANACRVRQAVREAFDLEVGAVRFREAIADRVAVELAGAVSGGPDRPSLVSTDRFQRTVTCAWCGNRYRSACPSDHDRGLQGSHCAADVVQEDGKWFVRGGYGSDEHDMHRYVFVANPPNAPADPVCDECISQRQQAGDLVDDGMEAVRRPGDFSPRPLGTWGLINQIRRLVEDMVPMRTLIEASIRAADAGHSELAEAVRVYREHQRFTGAIDDGGEAPAEGCPEIAAQLREAARELDNLAASWEEQR